jgi:hypothetical protein
VLIVLKLHRTDGRPVRNVHARGRQGRPRVSPIDRPKHVAVACGPPAALVEKKEAGQRIDMAAPACHRPVVAAILRLENRAAACRDDSAHAVKHVNRQHAHAIALGQIARELPGLAAVLGAPNQPARML